MSSSAPANIDLNADIKSTIIGPVIALMVLSAAAVALRIVSKWSIQMKKLQVDDYFIVAALIVAWGTGALSIIACSKGIGKHVWNPTVDLVAAIRVLWAYEFLYGSVNSLTKLSIIFYYYRIFPVPLFRKILYFVLFLAIGWWASTIGTAIFQCRPVSYLWNQFGDATASGTCINISAFFIGNGVTNVSIDFIILMTPIPVIWPLKMPIMQRLNLLGIFFLGGFVCIAGAVRVYGVTMFFKSADVTWNSSQSFIWSSVEPNIGIVCACLPTLRPLMRRSLPNWFASSSVTHSPLGASSVPTISKVRTRPLRQADTLEDTQFEDDDIFESRSRNQVCSTSGKLGPDEDEVQSTTIVTSTENHSGSVHTNNTADSTDSNATTQAGMW